MIAAFQIILLFYNFALALVVFFGDTSAKTSEKSKKNMFTLFTVSFTSWIGFQILQTATTSKAALDLILIFSFFSTVLSVIFFYLFSSFLAGKSRHTILHLSIGALLTVMSIVVPPIKVAVVNNEATFIYNDAWYSLLTFYTIFYLFLGILSLFKPDKKHVNKDFYKQRRTIFVGLSFGVILILLANVAFPLLGLGDIGEVLLVLGPAVIITSFSLAVFSFSLFNFRKFFYRTISYVATLLILGVLTAAMVSVLVAFGLSPQRIGELRKLELTLLFNLFIIIGIAVFLVAKKEIDVLLRRVYYLNTLDYVSLSSQLQPFLRSLDTDELMKNFSAVVQKEASADKILIFCINSKVSEITKQYIYSDVPIRDQFREVIFESLVDDNPKLLTKTLLDRFGYSQFYRISHENIEGYVLVGPKRNGRPYYNDDNIALNNAAIDLSLALQNAVQYQSILGFNEELENKIKAATKELKDANEKLIALDQTKDDFISMASHQLRTPLTSVKGYVSMVIEGDVGKITKQQHKLLDQAYISAQRMVYLIADLLNVSRLKTGKFIIEPKATNLADVVEGELSQLTETAKSRKLEIEYHKPKNFPSLMLDETKTRQVIMNFVDNAIYYTPAGGRIEVNLEDKDDHIEFTVVDNGIGVPKSEQHNLFNKFYRAGNARKARPDGTGLGLFMAKKVIVAQGGAIIFRTTEGKGSTFGFSFSKKSLKRLNSKVHDSEQAPNKA